MREAEVVIIGAGTAGLNARRSALKEGARSVLLIEGGAFGTTCARVGCMPSKLMIEPANIAEEARRATELGINASVSVDENQLLQRLRSERDRFVGFVVSSVENYPKSEVMKGTAKIVAPGKLLVDNQEVQYEKLIIATGSENLIPPPFQKLWSHQHAKDIILTNDTIFEVPKLPRRLAVIGAGVIGLELGQALHSLGVFVEIYSAKRPFGMLTDPACRDAAFKIFDQHLQVHWETEIVEASIENNEISLIIQEKDGGRDTRTYDAVLLAKGRRGRYHELGLENLGVTFDKNGKIPSLNLQTGQVGDLPLFFAGDVTGEIQLLHEAADEGRHAGRNAVHYPDVTPIKRRTRLQIMFTSPNIVVAGQTYQECHTKPHTIIGEVSYWRQGRARIMQKNEGILRIYANKEDRKLIGAEGIGPRLEHIAHLLAWSIQKGVTIEEALEMPFYHPVVEEGVRTALEELKNS